MRLKNEEPGLKKALGVGKLEGERNIGRKSPQGGENLPIRKLAGLRMGL
jgi:hypothetical protein